MAGGSPSERARVVAGGACRPAGGRPGAPRGGGRPDGGPRPARAARQLMGRSERQASQASRASAAAGRLGTIPGEQNFINLFNQSAVWSLRGAIAPFFDKLARNFTTVHAHPNNCCGSVTSRGLEIPRIAEFTFYRNDRFRHRVPRTVFPDPLADTFRKPHFRARLYLSFSVLRELVYGQVLQFARARRRPGGRGGPGVRRIGWKSGRAAPGQNPDHPASGRDRQTPVCSAPSPEQRVHEFRPGRFANARC